MMQTINRETNRNWKQQTGCAVVENGENHTLDSQRNVKTLSVEFQPKEETGKIP